MCLTSVFAFATLACGGGGDAVPAAEPAVMAVSPELLREGRTSYRKFCVQCHGYSGKGDGSSAAHLTPPPRDHTSVELMDPITDAEIAQTVRFGGVGRGYPNMPAFPHVADEELVALVAYVRSLSRPDVPSVDVGGLGQ